MSISEIVAAPKRSVRPGDDSETWRRWQGYLYEDEQRVLILLWNQIPDTASSVVETDERWLAKACGVSLLRLRHILSRLEALRLLTREPDAPPVKRSGSMAPG